MQRFILSRVRFSTGTVVALAALGGLGACGDYSQSYDYGEPGTYDSGTSHPPPPRGYDAGGADACNACGSSTCVDLGTDIANCGACGLACPGSDHGGATCARGTCGLTCDVGFESREGTCARVIAAPRAIAPMSGANVSTARPTLRWQLAPTTDGAAIDICPTRACDHDAQTFNANGERFVPPADLAPGPHFWRLHGRAANEAGVAPSPTWEFFVGHRSAPIDTSSGAVADLNGDGFADFVVADPAAARVYVYWGSAHGISEESRAILTTPANSIDPSDFVVVSAGDVDGDGFPDLAVGDAARDRVYVYRGGLDGPSDASMTILTSPFASTQSFGASVAAAGDVDGDGYADLIVGAGASDAVRIFRGGASGVSGANGTTLFAPEIGTGFGTSVAGAADVNGDGYADVIIGAPDANAGAGKVHVFLGGPTMLARGPSASIDGPDVAFGGFGRTLAIAGDVNGDGYADVIVGAPDSVSKRGRAYLFIGSRAGLPSNASTLFDGISAGDALGASVAGIGDIDGDGFADIAIGSPGIGAAIGRVDVYRGSATGIITGSFVTLVGPDGENFGASIGGGGDVDGDGFADFIVGTRGANHVYGFRGDGTKPLGSPSFTLSGPDTASRAFGRAVALLATHRRRFV